MSLSYHMMGQYIVVALDTFSELRCRQIDICPEIVVLTCRQFEICPKKNVEFSEAPEACGSLGRLVV